MQPGEKNYWFPAKTYGWGWGPPICWQGWAVMIAWMILLAGGGLALMPLHVGLFIIHVVTLSVILTFICYLKGEKPGWRWGADRSSSNSDLPQ
jgi:hypothetical protein